MRRDLIDGNSPKLNLHLNMSSQELEALNYSLKLGAAGLLASIETMLSAFKPDDVGFDALRFELFVSLIGEPYRHNHVRSAMYKECGWERCRKQAHWVQLVKL